MHQIIAGFEESDHAGMEGAAARNTCGTAQSTNFAMATWRETEKEKTNKEHADSFEPSLRCTTQSSHQAEKHGP